MVHLDELCGSARKDLDNSILVMLQAGRTTRDVAHELQVSQSHVARLRKKRLCDLPASSGGRPQVLMMHRRENVFVLSHQEVLKLLHKLPSMYARNAMLL